MEHSVDEDQPCVWGWQRERGGGAGWPRQHREAGTPAGPGTNAGMSELADQQNQ